MTEPSHPLSHQAHLALDRLRERLEGAPPWEGRGQRIEVASPGGLYADHGAVWLPLRHVVEGREPYEHSIALMPAEALERPEEALFRLAVWDEVLRTILAEAEPDRLARLSLGLLDRRALLMKKRVKSEEALREAYRRDATYGALLPVPVARDAKGRGAVEVVEAAFAEHFPAMGGVAEIDGAELWEERPKKAKAIPGAGIRVNLRLIVWEGEGDQRMVRDIKEQEVLLLPAEAFTQLERIEPYLQAWSEALREALKAAPLTKIEVLMPWDFAHPKVFTLKKAQTVEALRAAFLVPSRLGGLKG